MSNFFRRSFSGISIRDRDVPPESVQSHPPSATAADLQSASITDLPPASIATVLNVPLTSPKKPPPPPLRQNSFQMIAHRVNRWPMQPFSPPSRIPGESTEAVKNSNGVDAPSVELNGHSIKEPSPGSHTLSFGHIREPRSRSTQFSPEAQPDGTVDPTHSLSSQPDTPLSDVNELDTVSDSPAAAVSPSVKTTFLLPDPQCQDGKSISPARLAVPFHPEAGTGAKARRMSISLPDDFSIDIADLLSEFEYHHKILGRRGRHLGKGATSKVSLMFRKGLPNELFAVKEFRAKSSHETQYEYEKKIQSEFSIAKSLRHPNLVETFCLCTDHGRWNHVMEYCSARDLFGLVQKGYLKHESRQSDRLCLFRQVVQGVEYLHAHGIAHRDIKLENLLVTRNSKIKITDFGVSDVFSGIHPGLRQAGGQCGRDMGPIRLSSPGICGSEPYIAPEVLDKRGPYDPRALDVWGSAIVLVYLIFGGALWCRAEPGQPTYDTLVNAWQEWADTHPDDPLPAITDADYPSVPALDRHVKPPALRRVLVQMLNPDPSARISISNVAQNRFVRNIECCQPESYDQSLCIDATKNMTAAGTRKLYCHNHLQS